MTKKVSRLFNLIILAAWFLPAAVLAGATSTVNVSGEVIDWSTSTPPVSGGGVSTVDTEAPSILSFKLRNLAAESVDLYWELSEPVIADLEIGTSSGVFFANYEKRQYLRSFFFELKDLKPDTVYYFRAVFGDEAGNQAATESSFRTPLPSSDLGLPEVYPVENVADFRIQAERDRLFLHWAAGRSGLARQILILRSDKLFPQKEADGVVVYYGPEKPWNERFGYQDIEGLEPGRVYYYTIITIDQDGHRSSGALNFAALEMAPDGQSENPDEPFGGGNPQVIDKAKDKLPKATSQTDREEPALAKFGLDDVEFMLDNKKLYLEDKETIRIPRDGHLSVLVSKVKLMNKVERVVGRLEGDFAKDLVGFSYQEQSKYFLANLGQLKNGNYRFFMAFYDKQGKIIKNLEAKVAVAIQDVVLDGNSTTTASSSDDLANQVPVGLRLAVARFSDTPYRLIYLLLISLFVFFFWRLFWALGKKKQKKDGD